MQTNNQNIIGIKSAFDNMKKNNKFFVPIMIFIASIPFDTYTGITIIYQKLFGEFNGDKENIDDYNKVIDTYNNIINPLAFTYSVAIVTLISIIVVASLPSNVFKFINNLELVYILSIIYLSIILYNYYSLFNTVTDFEKNKSKLGNEIIDNIKSSYNLVKISGAMKTVTSTIFINLALKP